MREGGGGEEGPVEPMPHVRCHAMDLHRYHHVWSRWETWEGDCCFPTLQKSKLSVILPGSHAYSVVSTDSKSRALFVILVWHCPYTSQRLWPWGHHQVLKGRWREVSCSNPLLCENILDSSHITKLWSSKGCYRSFSWYYYISNEKAETSRVKILFLKSCGY